MCFNEYVSFASFAAAVAINAFVMSSNEASPHVRAICLFFMFVALMQLVDRAAPAAEDALEAGATQGKAKKAKKAKTAMKAKTAKPASVANTPKGVKPRIRKAAVPIG